MPKSIPTIGQQNWGTSLNSHLAQVFDPITGGINTRSGNPSGLTSEDQGYTFIDTTTGQIKVYKGSGDSTNNANYHIGSTNVQYSTQNKTTNYTLTANDCNGFNTFTNTGATGTVTFTLPTAVVGMKVTIFNIENQTVKIQTDSESSNKIYSTIITSGTKILANTTKFSDAILIAIDNGWIVNSTNSVNWIDGEIQAPASLGIVVNAYNQITINWTDNSTNETNFRIYRSTDGSNFSALSTVGANVTSYQDNSVANSTQYWYKVTAYNAVNESSFSNIVNGTTPVAINSPSSLGIVVNAYNQITINWTDNSTNETNFRIYRSTDGSNFSALSTVGVNVTSYQDNSVASSTQYWYKVTAYNAINESSFSNIVNGTTPINPTIDPNNFSANPALYAGYIQVGWHLGGGIVISTNGTSGTIIENFNKTTTSWKIYNTSTAGTNGSSDGEVNTNAMATAGISDHPAGESCYNSSDYGFSNWYLPAEMELETMSSVWNSKGQPSDWGITLYDEFWSSTQVSSLCAYTIVVDAGSGLRYDTSYKYVSFKVRAFRHF